MANATQTSRPVVVSCPFCGTANRVDLARLSAGPKCAQCGRPIKLDRPLHVTDADFEKIIAGSSVPVLVDFHADWCGPCKMMAPVLDEVARRHMGDVLVLKLDTDAHPATPSRLGIRGIPTLIVFEHGRESRRLVGATQMPELEKLLGMDQPERQA
ncbi:MAG: thioredoxin [Gemmatimonadales bacterium]|nr:thioredoxin [Gemmatimonadales bacterium]